jgi:hypothetical protein
MTHTASALKTRSRQLAQEVDIHVPATVVVVKSNHAALTVILGWPRNDIRVLYRVPAQAISRHLYWYDFNFLLRESVW